MDTPPPEGSGASRRQRHLLLILLAGVLVLLPSVNSAYLLDDFMHASMVSGSVGMQRGPFSLYDFVNDVDRPLMLERGLLPWWSDPRLTIRFFRPLSSALRYVELHALGPDGVLLSHVHSLLWWALAALAAAALFRRMLAPRPSLVATAIFALGPWQVLPVAWLANREALISLAFGFLALRQQLQLRDEGGARPAILATLAFLAAFAAGEYAFCVGGYVLASELVVRRGRPIARVARLATFAVPALGYLLVRRLGGFGTLGSAFYADPLAEPLKILRLAPRRLVTLLAEGWLTLGTDAWGTSAPLWVIVTLVVGVGVAVVLALWHLFHRLDRDLAARARFLVLGSLLSIAPVLAAVPSPRLLGSAAFGMAGAVALLIEHAWFTAPAGPRGRREELVGLVALLLGFLQLVHGPAAAFLAGLELSRSTHGYARSIERLADRLAARHREEVHILRGAGGAFFGQFALAGAGTSPRRWRILSQAPHVLLLRRDPHTFELVAPASAGLYPDGPTNLFRDRDHPLAVGDVVEVPGLRVEILQVEGRVPTRARFRFARPLETAAFAWIDERAVGLEEVELPRVGFGKPFDP